MSNMQQDKHSIKKFRRLVGDKIIMSMKRNKHSNTNKITLDLTSCVERKNMDQTLKKILSIEEQNWPKITQLMIDQSLVNFQTIKQLTKREIPSLEILHIQYNNQKTTNEYWMKMIQKNQTIEKLALYTCGLLDRDMALFHEDYFKKIKFLLIYENRIGNNGVKILIKSDFPNLTHIQFYRCKISCEGAKHLIKLNCPLLQHISFAQPQYYGLIDDVTPETNLTFLNSTQNFYIIDAINLKTIQFGNTEPICILNRALFITVQICFPSFNNYRLNYNINTLFQRIRKEPEPEPESQSSDDDD